MNEKRTRKRKAADMRPRVLLNCKEALFFWENLPVVVFTLVVETEGDAVLVIGPAADHVVSVEVVDSPIHVSCFKEHLREKPLLSGLCEFNCVLRYYR